MPQNYMQKYTELSGFIFWDYVLLFCVLTFDTSSYAQSGVHSKPHLYNQMSQERDYCDIMFS